MRGQAMRCLQARTRRTFWTFCARRGQRLGTDEAADDKLATLITRDEEATEAPRLQPVEPVEDEDPEEHVTETLPGLDEIQRRGGSEEAGATEAETGSEAEVGLRCSGRRRLGLQLRR